MADDSSPPPPEDPTELAADLCPNCGGKLKFSENRPEGLCPSCGIFVEILRPSASKPRAPVRPLPPKIKIRTGTARELQVLCHKYGLPSDGTKADLVARLLFYIDEQGWQAKVSAGKAEKPASLPAEDVASRKQWAKFVLNYESELGEDGLDAEDEKPALEQPSPAEGAEPTPETPVAPQAETVPVETVTVRSPEAAPKAKPPEPALPQEQARKRPKPSDRDSSTQEIKEAELPPPPEAEAVPEPTPELDGEIPTVTDEIVPAEPVTEPEAEPVATEFDSQAVPVPAARASPVLKGQSVAARSTTPPVPRSRWRRAFYYVGVFYVTLGGAGLILGSFLHDIFRVPLFGGAYDAFGRLNLDAALIGTIFVGVGFAAMAVGLRRISMRTVSAAGA